MAQSLSDHHQALFVKKVNAEPLWLCIDEKTRRFSGIYRATMKDYQLGLADLGCGLGGFSLGGTVAGPWKPVVAVDSNPQATQAYGKLHDPSTPCILADLGLPSTLHQVSSFTPAVLAWSLTSTSTVLTEQGATTPGTAVPPSSCF